MPKLTKHGKKRISQRVGVSSGMAKRNAAKAFQYGIKHSETLGKLNGWLNGKFYAYKKNNSRMRVFKDHLYVFTADATLITVYPIPEEFKDNFEQYVEPNAYYKYMQYLRTGMAVNADKSRKKNSKKYKEKREAFNNLVMMNDIKEFVEGRYDISIVGVTTNGNKISVRYTPNKTDIPELGALYDYIRDHTHYRSVHVFHAKGADGKRIFNKKYSIDPDEDELVYSC